MSPTGRGLGLPLRSMSEGCSSSSCTRQRPGAQKEACPSLSLPRVPSVPPAGQAATHPPLRFLSRLPHFLFFHDFKKNDLTSNPSCAESRKMISIILRIIGVVPLREYVTHGERRRERSPAGPGFLPRGTEESSYSVRPQIDIQRAGPPPKHPPPNPPHAPTSN